MYRPYDWPMQSFWSGMRRATMQTYIGTIRPYILKKTMENPTSNNPRKLSKRELRVIMGGLMRCIDPFTGQCKTVSKSCGERECRPDPIVP